MLHQLHQRDLTVHSTPSIIDKAAFWLVQNLSLCITKIIRQIKLHGWVFWIITILQHSFDPNKYGCRAINMQSMKKANELSTDGWLCKEIIEGWKMCYGITINVPFFTFFAFLLFRTGILIVTRAAGTIWWNHYIYLRGSELSLKSRL